GGRSSVPPGWASGPEGRRPSSRPEVADLPCGALAMLALAPPLPCRRPELVARPFAEGGYLIRNRRAGESFQLGPTEHFLLAGLDGRRTAEGLCAAFAEHFGEPLAA